MRRESSTGVLALGAVLFLTAASSPSRLAPVPKASPASEQENTRCEACHTPQGWYSAAFPHDRTGFPLEGAHAKVLCRRCHAVDLQSPIPRDCAGCHRDAHSGEFGQRCEGCHAPANWASEFNADAHRRTNFPLLGRHAALPCQECHLDRRGPNFRLSTVECVGCHQTDYDRTALTSVNHAVAGFSTRCRDCHETWTFKGGRFPGHDVCFQLVGTVHANISCLGCHTSLASAKVTGACATHTAACTACHTHACDHTDPIHVTVPGYQCKDQKCYECHRFSTRL